jgi:tripartite-type tricarboxylate transporter receptor subunit TctC
VPVRRGGVIESSLLLLMLNVARLITFALKRWLKPPCRRRRCGHGAIENRAGAGGVIGSSAVSKSPADGYTLVFGTIASHGILPVMQKPAPYDALKDFAPVTLVALTPNVLVANPSVPFRSVAELLAPSATPKAITELLQRHITAILRQPEIEKLFLEQGAESVANTPEEFGRLISLELQKWGKVVANTGVKLD